MQEGGATGSGSPPNPSHPVSSTATDAQELPAVPMRHTQPKNHLRSLDMRSEMICAAGDLGTVEALCCAQMLIECRKDRRYRIEQPDDKHLIFIQDYEVIVTIRCLCLRMTHVFHNFLELMILISFYFYLKTKGLVFWT